MAMTAVQPWGSLKRALTGTFRRLCLRALTILTVTTCAALPKWLRALVMRCAGLTFVQVSVAIAARPSVSVRAVPLATLQRLLVNAMVILRELTLAVQARATQRRARVLSCVQPGVSRAIPWLRPSGGQFRAGLSTRRFGECPSSAITCRPGGRGLAATGSKLFRSAHLPRMMARRVRPASHLARPRVIVRTSEASCAPESS
mmetsp:Transcript_957/g.2169  ORF Transcript_957/g.2169 Transcript_957/m.2169 type:complete len:202 (+) Transcript_957:4477-5082(+)